MSNYPSQMKKQPQDSKPQRGDKYIVRFPDGMRARLKKAASTNSRSMNAEVLHILATGLPLPQETAPVDLSAISTADLMAEIGRRCK